jgi:cyanophycinase-like exopeptidase
MAQDWIILDKGWAMSLFKRGASARLVLCSVLASMMLPWAGAEAANKSKLSIYQHGKAIKGLSCPAPLPRQTAVLMGGGKDVSSAYSWMIDAMRNCDGSNNPSGKPANFVVLRAGGNPSYDSYISKLGPVASVITLVIPDKSSANDPALTNYIKNASALWLTGGDQGDYYNFWQGTLLEKLVANQVNTQHVPIGGTSAGMMILSQFVYTADPNSVTSTQALADPYLSGYVTLRSDFWADSPSGTPYPPLVNTITDSHFVARDRMGRLVAFLGRAIADGWASQGAARAIGVDEQTALAMTYDPAGAGSSSVTVLANPGIAGAAYLLSAANNADVVISPGTPVTLSTVNVEKLSANGAVVDYQISVENGVLSPADPY